MFRGRQPGFIQLAFGDRRYRLVVCSLNPQEVSMGVQSIWAAVEPGHPARNGFLGATVEVAF